MLGQEGDSMDRHHQQRDRDHVSAVEYAHYAPRVLQMGVAHFYDKR